MVAYAFVDPQDADLAKHRWCMVGGYAVRQLSRREGRKWLRMHRVIIHAPVGVDVDHKNRNRLDNRRCNLRLTDRGGNARNRSRNEKNTSGYKGVRRFGRDNDRWVAQIRYEGRVHYLGIYETAEEAAVTYDLAAMALHGEFAAPNFSYPEPLPMLGELRALLLWFIGKRIQWHRPYDKLRKRLRPFDGAMYVVPCSGPSARRFDLIQQIVASAAEILRVD